MVVLADKSSDSGSNNILGDSLALLSALGAAVYLVFAKYSFVKYHHSPTTLLGFVGLWFVILMVPIIASANAIGIESFRVPSSSISLWIVLLSLCGIGFNIFLNLALERSSPLFVRISLALSLPFSYSVDLIAHLASFSLLKTFGSFLVLCSLLAFAFIEDNHITTEPEEITLLPHEDSKEYNLVYQTP